MRLSTEDAFTVVRLAPVPSIDLVIKDHAGLFLVGLRTNRPAAGQWFVPGGRIQKEETFAAAFSRLCRDELSTEVTIDCARFLGAFEHFYDDNFLSVPGITTHYIALAYAIDLDLSIESLPRDQHIDYKWLEESALLTDSTVHENTKMYVKLMVAG